MPTKRETALAFGVKSSEFHTVATALDANGAIVGFAIHDSANIHRTDEVYVARIIGEALTMLLGNTRHGRFEFDPTRDRCCFACSGLDSRNDFRRMRRIIAKSAVAGLPYVMTNEVEAAIYANTLRPAGIVITCGTGSAVFGRGLGRAQRKAHTGGWGHIIGDCGSAYYFGLRGIQVVTAQRDGTGDRTELTQALLAHIDVAKPRDVVYWLYDHLGPKTRRRHVAALAPLVTACAERGDHVCRGILREAADDLVGRYNVVARRSRLASRRHSVVLEGGVLRGSKLFADMLTERIGRCQPLAVCQPAIRNSAFGAALIALGRTQGGRTDRFLSKVRLPPYPLCSKAAVSYDSDRQYRKSAMQWYRHTRRDEPIPMDLWETDPHAP